MFKLHQKWFRLIAPTSLVALCGLALTIFFTLKFESDERVARTLAFADMARADILDVERAFEREVELMSSLQNVFMNVGPVSSAQFDDYAKEVLERYPYIQALEWAPRVVLRNRFEFEREGRALRGPGFKITQRAEQGHMIEAGERAEYFPVHFIQPVAGNKAALGFDLNSNARRKQTIEQAMLTGKPAVTAPITLVQETEEMAGILILAPVYSGAVSTVSERRGNFSGVTLGVFRVGEVMNTVLSQNSRHSGGMQGRIDYYALDETVADRVELIHCSGSKCQSEFSPSQVRTPAPFVFQSSFNLGGRKWTLVARSTDFAMHRSVSVKSLIVLIGGVVLTGLLCLYLFHMLRRKEAVEAAVCIRTRQLNEARGLLEEKNGILEELASTDVLTGVRNRRAVLELAREEVTRKKRYGGQLSLAFMDLDFFKKINDAYGHGAGDTVLKRFAGMCQSMMRDCDYLGRIGGEEFVIVLTETDLEGASTFVERIRKAWEHERHEVEGKWIGATVSIGVVELDAVDKNLDELLARADEALYSAKEAGRNRVYAAMTGLAPVGKATA